MLRVPRRPAEFAAPALNAYGIAARTSQTNAVPFLWAVTSRLPSGEKPRLSDVSNDPKKRNSSAELAVVIPRKITTKHQIETNGNPNERFIILSDYKIFTPIKLMV